MKSKLSSKILVVIAAGAMIAAVGCCKKPPEELGQAEAAVASAKENCAEQFASDQYKQAYDALSMAQQYADDRKCKDARASSLQAIELAASAEKAANEKRAELNTEIKNLIADIQKRSTDGQAAFADLQAKHQEVSTKRAAAMQVAAEKDFAKYNISMDLPEATLNPQIETDGMAIMEHIERSTAMFDPDACNQLDVLAELNKVPGMAEPIMKMMEDNSRELDELSALIDRTLQTKLAELEEAMKPKYLTAHAVAKGDTLWGIAETEMVYNDPFQWPLIWWENKWTEEKAQGMSKEDRFNLIKDPDLIFPGQQLKLGQEVPEDEVASAVKYARNRYGATDWRDIPDFLTDGK